MAYNYTENDLLENFQSRVDNKIFIFRSATGAYKDDEDYDTRSQALAKVIEYDTKKLPLLPTTNNSTTTSDIIKFYYYNGSNYTECTFTSGVVAQIDVTNKSAIPYGDPTADNIDNIKNAITEIQNAYNKIDKIVISNLSDISYERDILVTLLYNINNAFSLNIPMDINNDSATIYLYNKLTKSWEKQTT